MNERGEARLQVSAATHQARLDGAEMDAKDFGDLFIAEALDVAQHDYGLEGLGNLADGGFDLVAQLSVGGEVEGRLLPVDKRVFEMKGLAILPGELLLDSDLLALVAAPPAALVGGFVQGDAVDPGAEAGFAMEVGDAAVDLNEDVLGDVGGFAGIGDGARDERIERARGTGR